MININRRRLLTTLIVTVLFGMTAWWSYAQDTLQVGYSVVRLESGTGIPAGTAVFSFTNGDGVLVTEAGSQAHS